MTDFHLLGPLEAIADGRPVALPAGKPRALLARLLLESERALPVETLVESLWGERPPPSAYKVLQVYVSQLRKALGAERIETRAPGYLLRVARDEIDLGRFEALAEAARDERDSARRAGIVSEALSLWRGPALAEFRDEPFARPAARRLAELRLTALEQRIDAELELGEHARLVAELEALVAEEPLREGPRRRLMVVLYRCGRQADALACYREGRRRLVEELGVEPSPALQELERAILRHDPQLAQPQHMHMGTPAPAQRCVMCVGAHVHELVVPLCTDGRELLLVEIAQESGQLSRLAAELEERRRQATVPVRTACFTSPEPQEDVARLAVDQQADLLVVTREDLVGSQPCDVALVLRPDLPFTSGPVLVPFGGGRDEWAALELGAWLARSHGLPLRLLGTEARDDRRDASRMLAGASLALQRFAGTAAEPVIVAPGPEGILSESGSVIVASLPAGGLDRTRRALVERSPVPVLLVRAGLRPSGLAPERTLTRFSWSLADA